MRTTLIKCFRPFSQRPAQVRDKADPLRVVSSHASECKSCLFLVALAGFAFATSRVTSGLRCMRPTYPVAPTFYPNPVRRAHDLPYLSSAGSIRQVPPHRGHPCFAWRFLSLSPGEDFHLLEPRHAWHTQKGPSQLGWPQPGPRESPVQGTSRPFPFSPKCVDGHTGLPIVHAR